MTSFKTLLNALRALIQGVDTRLTEISARLTDRLRSLETWADKFEWVPTSDVQVIYPETKLEGFTNPTRPSSTDWLVSGYDLTLEGRNVLFGTKDGDDVIVTWDGVEYSCTVFQFNISDIRYYVAGNFDYLDRLFAKNVDTSYSADVPFVIVGLTSSVDGTTLNYSDISAGDDSATSHTLAIRAEKTDKIPEKFLPSPATEESDWNPALKETVLFDDQTVSGFSQAGSDEYLAGYYKKMSGANVLSGLSNGDYVTVTWDGVDYTCPVFAGSAILFNTVYVGDFGLIKDPLRRFIDFEQSSTVPFCIMVELASDDTDTDISAFITDDTANSHTVSIAKNDSDVLPAAFLPDGYPAGDRGELLMLSGKAGSLTYYVAGTGAALEEGRIYSVILDGRSYVCKAYTTADGTVYIGDPCMIGSGTDNSDEPFCIYNSDSDLAIEWVLAPKLLPQGYPAIFVRLYSGPIDTMASEYIPSNVWSKIDNNTLQLAELTKKVGDDPLATEDYVTQAIQSAVDDTWEASY